MNAHDEKYYTLYYAVDNQRHTCVEALIKAGTEVDKEVVKYVVWSDNIHYL